MYKEKISMALLQLDYEFGNVKYNIDKSIEYIKEAVNNGANFICLTETFNTGYYNKEYPKVLPLAEEITGKTINKMREIAVEYKVFILAPIVLKVQNGIYENSAVLIDDEGEILGNYSKTHLVGPEQMYFKRGNKYPVFKTRFGNIGIVICYDVCFPETSRILAIKGADLILVPSAWRKGYKDWWDINLACRAIDNTVFVAAVNRVGTIGDSTFLGCSKVVAPSGKVLIDGAEDEEKIYYCEIDLNTIAEERQNNTVMIDRKPQDYLLVSDTGM